MPFGQQAYAGRTHMVRILARDTGFRNVEWECSSRLETEVVEKRNRPLHPCTVGAMEPNLSIEDGPYFGGIWKSG